MTDDAIGDGRVILETWLMTGMEGYIRQMTGQEPSQEPSLERARAELSSGAWVRARASFEDVLADDVSPEALFGLAVASWWLGDTEAALSGWERAYTTAVERDDLPQAVFSAVYLCLGYEMSLGNEAIATGWVELRTNSCRASN